MNNLLPNIIAHIQRRLDIRSVVALSSVNKHHRESLQNIQVYVNEAIRSTVIDRKLRRMCGLLPNILVLDLGHIYDSNGFQGLLYLGHMPHLRCFRLYNYADDNVVIHASKARRIESIYTTMQVIIGKQNKALTELECDECNFCVIPQLSNLRTLIVHYDFRSNNKNKGITINSNSLRHFYSDFTFLRNGSSTPGLQFLECYPLKKKLLRNMPVLKVLISSFGRVGMELRSLTSANIRCGASLPLQNIKYLYCDRFLADKISAPNLEKLWILAKHEPRFDRIMERNPKLSHVITEYSEDNVIVQHKCMGKMISYKTGLMNPFMPPSSLRCFGEYVQRAPLYTRDTQTGELRTRYLWEMCVNKYLE